MPKGFEGFQKGHKSFKGCEKGWFKKGYPKPKNAYTFPKGKNNPIWKGKIINNGYICILKPNHPFCNKDGYVFKSHLIMEKYLRKNKPNHPALVEINGIKYLRRKWVVHHKGIKYPLGSIENKQDDRIKNLQLFANKSKHTKFHWFLKKNNQS